MGRQDLLVYLQGLESGDWLGIYITGRPWPGEACWQAAASPETTNSAGHIVCKYPAESTGQKTLTHTCQRPILGLKSPPWSPATQDLSTHFACTHGIRLSPQMPSPA